MKLTNLNIGRLLSLFSGLGITAFLVAASGAVPGAVVHADIVGTITCGSSSSTFDPTCGNASITVSSGQYSSTGVDVSLTAISGATSPPLDAFQIALDSVNSSNWVFAFNTTTGTWTLSNITAVAGFAGDTFVDTGTITSVTPGADSVTLVLEPLTAMFNEAATGGTSGTYDIEGIATGTATITYTGDPTITGVTVTEDTKTAPEPSSLLLLSLGLAGLMALYGLSRRQALVS